MSRRKKISGGQAIVLVTLALVSMAGMMGLAVDLGWSYFTQKEAQASADGAALAAVHETWSRLGGTVSGGVSCGANSSCASTPVDCGTGVATGGSNLYNGCLYAINNGFNYATNTSIRVRVQADIGTSSLPKTPTGGALNINNIAYWVTVRTVKNIPQLFSAVLGNTKGTISAIGTAAVVAVTVPGSFYGMNQVGDCLTVSGVRDNCGVDINVKGNGSVCPNSGGVSAVLCGPDGIFLASQCNGSTIPAGATAGSCGGGNANYAGMTDKTNTKVWANIPIQIAGNGAANNPGSFIPSVTNSSPNTGDPFEGKVQPPILAPSGTGTCEIPNGTINGSNNKNSPVLLPAYQYYSKKTVGGVPQYGDPLTINGYVRFVSSGGSCPGTASGSPMSGTFTSTILWGGLNVTGNNAGADFTGGQYVLAGVRNPSNVAVLDTFNSTLSCSTCGTSGSSGVMFITTDDTYEPVTIGGTTYSLTKPSVLSSTTFYQGNVSMKNTDVTLTGIDFNIAPTSLIDYNNILFWQDRRNSTDTYNSLGFVTTKSINGAPPSANHVTPTSPDFTLNHGNVITQLTGVIHQPRGAWLDLSSGTGAVSNSQLQIYTGAIFCDPCGNASATLLPAAEPVTTYKTSLIQ
jgi:hypothetical protein